MKTKSQSTRPSEPDPELDALSWNPTVEEADAYLRGHGVIKKCEICGQDATLTNDFVTHLIARHANVAREHEALLSALKETLNFGVELDDGRLGYVVAHLDRDAIAAAHAAIALVESKESK